MHSAFIDHIIYCVSQLETMIYGVILALFYYYFLSNIWMVMPPITWAKCLKPTSPLLNITYYQSSVSVFALFIPNIKI